MECSEVNMEDLHKYVMLNNGVNLPIHIHNFNYLHIRKHEIKSVIGFHYNNHDYCIYEDCGFTGDEYSIPSSHIKNNIVRIKPKWIEPERLNDVGLMNKLNEVNGRYNIKNPILCYSSILIKNYGLQPEQLATEFDELAVSGRFCHDNMDIQKYSITYDTLCELIRNF
jgi:hypothetical protein